IAGQIGVDLDLHSPAVRRSSPGRCFRSATASAASPSSSVLFHLSSSRKPVEATNLGRLFIRSVNGSPDRNGQGATNSSYVTRPSRSAPLANSWSVCHFEISSFPVGDRPAAVLDSPAGPGSSITPSRDRYSAATIRLISLAFGSGLRRVGFGDDRRDSAP